MMEDFNVHYDVENPSGNSDVGGKLNSFLESNNVAQLIAEPTRVTFNSSTMLDLVITNCPECLSASGTLSPPSNCDHSVIFASMNLFTHRSRSYKRHAWNFNDINITDLNWELSQLFSLCENSNDIDEMYSCWYSYLHSVIEKYIPLKMVTIRPNDKPWMDSKVHLAIRRQDRQLKEDYHPVSLLPSFSKICERVVFFHLYNFLMEIGFLYKFHSGFRPGDSTINQLIFLVHKIYEALEGGKEVRVVFLGISKAFDKVWHAGLLCKLEALGIQSPLLKWFDNYLYNQKQRVVIEVQCSDWRSINSGVPHGSVLGLLLFLIYMYINDITDDLASLPLIYADDTTLLEIVDDPAVSAGRLSSDLNKIAVWADKWLVTIESCENS